MSHHPATLLTAAPEWTAPLTAEPKQPLRLRPVLGGTFRANPGYELLPWDSLPAERRDLFGELKNDSELFGVLQPREGFNLPVKSACRETGLLFSSLREAGKLPEFVTAGATPGAAQAEVNRAIAQLVLDGVMQISSGGEMVHGMRAFATVCEPSGPGSATTRIAQLSHEALLYAQALPFRDAMLLSSRLYAWGRIPASPSWKKKFPCEDALQRCLEVHQGGSNTLRLARHWQGVPPDPENDGWMFWQSTKPVASGPRAAYKLYLSPHPTHLRDAFEAMIPALERSGANAFKIGKDLSGVLRPDKMIAYFSRFEQVEEAARRILTTLEGCPAHGVPFTAQLDSPLLSWGADPPAERDVPAWLTRQSWRLWVTNRLAVALVAAKEQLQRDSDSAIGIEPWKFAMDRLAMEGVDTDTWSPLRKDGN